MRHIIAIICLAGAVAGCGSPTSDDCVCPSGLVCCTGSNRCVAENTPEQCDPATATADLAPPNRGTDLATADLARADLAPSSTPDLAVSIGFEPAQAALGGVTIGNSSGATISILNPSGALIYSVGLTNTANGQLSVDTDCQGTSSPFCTAIVNFHALQPGPVSASFVVATSGGDFTGCAISANSIATTAQLTVDRQSIDFGDQHVATTSAALSFLVTNVGDGSTGYLTDLSGISAPFALDTVSHFDACGVPLSPGGSCHVYLVFAPTQEGPASGTVGLGDGNVTSPAVTLGGKGIDPASLQVSAGNFPSVWMPGTADVAFHVSNGGGDATGTLGATVGGTDVADFSIVDDGCTGKTLAHGGSCDVTVRFTANTRGQRQALLVVSDGGSNSANGLLQATASQPGTISVSSGNGTITTAVGPVIISYILQNSGDGSFGPLTALLDGTSGSVFSVLTSSGCVTNVVNAGQTCELDIQFVPPYQGHYTDGVTLTSPGAPAPVTPLHLPLDATFASTDTLRASPSPLKIGSVNTAGWDVVTIHNTTAQPIGPLSDTVSGDSNFSIFDDSSCAGQTLAAGGNCQIKVEYTPTYSGTFTGTLAVTAPNGSVSDALSASSTLPGLAFSPAKVDFGTVAITNIPPITVTITNVSNAPQSTSYILTNTSFWVVNSCPATLLPIAGSNTCTISVGFSPTQAATYNATLNFSQAHAQSLLALTGIAQ